MKTKTERGPLKPGQGCAVQITRATKDMQHYYVAAARGMRASSTVSNTAAVVKLSRKLLGHPTAITPSTARIWRYRD